MSPVSLAFPPVLPGLFLFFCPYLVFVFLWFSLLFSFLFHLPLPAPSVFLAFGFFVLGLCILNLLGFDSQL